MCWLDFDHMLDTHFLTVNMCATQTTKCGNFCQVPSTVLQFVLCDRPGECSSDVHNKKLSLHQKFSHFKIIIKNLLADGLPWLLPVG